MAGKEGRNSESPQAGYTDIPSYRAAEEVCWGERALISREGVACQQPEPCGTPSLLAGQVNKQQLGGEEGGGEEGCQPGKEY